MSLRSWSKASLILLAMPVIAQASALPAQHAGSPGSPIMSIPMSRRGPLQWNHNAQEGTVAVPLTNGYAVVSNPNSLRASYYYFGLQVGTPPQPVQVILDTGSSDFLVKGLDYCDTTFGTFCYNHNQSTTAAKANIPDFSGHYGGGGQGALNGTFYSDDITIGGVKLKSVDMVVLQNGTMNSYGGGLLGLGPRTSESPDLRHNVSYPQVLDILYSSGYIKSHSYGLYLDNLFAVSGSIVFGGYDTAKYIRPLVTLPMVPSGGHLAVNWLSFSFTDSSGNISGEVVHNGSVAGILDSGTPFASIPNATYNAIIKQIKILGYEMDPVTGTIDCALGQAPGSMNLVFSDPQTGASVKIAVPWSEFTIAFEAGYCFLGVNIGPPDLVIFGDTFMRSMYVVVNMDKDTISLAQANFNQYASNIVPIE